MSKEIELVESSRGKNLPAENNTNNGNEMENVLADNMENMIEIAKDIVEIKKMQVQSDAVLRKMAEDRKMLLAEAEAYALRKNTDSKNVVDKMKTVQDLLKDFYTFSKDKNNGLSGEEFVKVISELLDKMD